MRYAKIPTKGSRLAAGHDIYTLTDGTIPAQRQMLVDTGIAIGLPKGTYRGIAARRGLASKHGIAIGGGVIDADFRGEVKEILWNHGKNDYECKVGDRIAQLIVERIQTNKAIGVEQLVETEHGTKGFGSSDIGTKRLITKEEHQVIICFLHPNPTNKTYYDKEDIHTDPNLTQEVTMLSSTIIVAVQIQTMDDSFLDRIRAVGKEDDGWMESQGESS